MRIDVNSSSELQKYIDKIDCYVKQNYNLKWTKYLTVGSKTVRLF